VSLLNGKRSNLTKKENRMNKKLFITSVAMALINSALLANTHEVIMTIEHDLPNSHHVSVRYSSGSKNATIKDVIPDASGKTFKMLVDDLEMAVCQPDERSVVAIINVPAHNDPYSYEFPVCWPHVPYYSHEGQPLQSFKVSITKKEDDLMGQVSEITYQKK
jgi:hypothetical protein